MSKAPFNVRFKTIVCAVLLTALSACAPTQTTPPSIAAPAPAPPLTIASWNLEHLAEHDGAGCRARNEPDYAAMRAYAEAINADVIAFQEVENEAAAERVFDPTRYQIIIEARPGSGRRTACSDRPDAFMTRQAVGFAVRRDLNVTRFADVTALQAGGQDLRSGVDIAVNRPGTAPLRLLVVHLKSGCFEGAARTDCPRLFEQIPIVEAWIDARAREGVRFGVLGDFNRRLALPGDSVWADWDDGEPAGADLALAAGAVEPHCDPRYHDFIDHIVLDQRAARSATGFREWPFPGPRLSDHCALSVRL